MPKFSADICPKCDGSTPIFCHTKNQKYMILNVKSGDWVRIKKKFNIDWWAYCEDIEYELTFFI